MLTLAIETATDLVGCALAEDDAVVATFELAHGRRHAESLLPVVDACLAQIGATIERVGAVVADVGPGLFTGLRVGLATARSLAYALELPVAAVSSLEVLAHDAALAGRVVCAAIDARRGELFWQLFRPDADAAAAAGAGVAPAAGPDGGLRPVRAVGGPFCSPPDELAAELRGLGEPVVLVGDAGDRYAAALGDVRDLTFAGPAHRHPSAATLVRLGLRELRAGRALTPEQLEPRYLRAPDAAINWSTRDGAVRA